MHRKPYSHERTFAGRLPMGIDLLAAITRIANEESVKTGLVTVYGMVSRLALNRFDQATRTSQIVELEEGLEIAGLSGTISQFKGRSMARLGGTFVRADGSAVGGTLGLGTIVFACEAVITELAGGTLTRDFDMATGLPLWKENSLLIEGAEPPAREDASGPPW